MMSMRGLKNALQHEEIRLLVSDLAICIILASPWIYRVLTAGLDGNFRAMLGWTIGGILAVAYCAITNFELMYIIMILGISIAITIPGWGLSAGSGLILTMYAIIFLSLLFEELSALHRR